MSHLEFTPEEQDLLVEVLENTLERLDIEIGRTDSHDYRDALKHRRKLMKALREKVATAPVAVH